MDMFPQTAHVETVCLLSKLKSANHVEAGLNLDKLDLMDMGEDEEIKAQV